MKLSLLLSCLLLASCVSVAQIRKPTPNPTPSDEAPLAPLTQAERALDLKSILTKQPDFVADEEFFYGEGSGGFSAKRHIARKGNRYFADTGYVKTITEPGKEIRLNDSDKTFEETPIASEFVLGSGQPIDPRTLASQDGVTFVALGTQLIDGHKCVKIQARIPNQRAQVFVYAAEDLKYLIVAVQVLNPPRGAIQRLQNISLDVPDGLVEVPANYSPLSKHKWLRVESAIVTYDGKPGKNARVFRSDDVNVLFVTLYEPHPATGLLLPWHYLVFLKEQTVELAFEGMLITKDGKLAWDTNAREAFSNGDDKPSNGNYPCHVQKCPPTNVGTNFVQFPSVYYDDRKSTVRVTW
ncbi:MAG: hypothetical protein ND895_03715 [Pyrinomonadaceae bacterium]|nr:hypothetical protein [Pyrinomonadaceae bacterium]